MINGIHHIALKCCSKEEYEKTIAFYKEVLGLPVTRTWESGIMLSAGSSLIEIFNNADAPLPQGAIRHFAFAVNNVEECVNAVTKAGYDVFMGPKDICIPSVPPFPARVAFCIGPAGEEIEFFEEK